MLPPTSRKCHTFLCLSRKCQTFLCVCPVRARDIQFQPQPLGSCYATSWHTGTTNIFSVSFSLQASASGRLFLFLHTTLLRIYFCGSFLLRNSHSQRPFCDKISTHVPSRRGLAYIFMMLLKMKIRVILIEQRDDTT